MKLMLFTLITFTSLMANSFAGVTKSGEYSGIYGIRNYKIYLPKDGTQKNLSMIVMLHGCEQSPDEFAKSSHILEWAEKENFAVLLPDQSQMYNPFKCWNWIIPGNNSRFGEPQVVVEMVDAVIKDYGIKKDKVFAAGMSAGASLAGILGNCYPERFKAIASHDGVQFYPTYTGADFLTVVLNGANVPAEQSAYFGYACSVMYGAPKKMPIVIFHGLASPLMNPLHAFQVEDEFNALNDYLDNGMRDMSSIGNKLVETVPDTNKYGYTKYSIVDKNGVSFIERYMVNRLNHSWSGGDGKYKYNDPNGPDATGIIVKFFKRFGL